MSTSARWTSGFPTSRCTALTRPGSFTAGNLKFTHPGLFLEANTDYTVVIKQRGSQHVTLDSTTSGREDSTGLTGWSIKNKYDVKVSGDWEHKSGSNEAIQITVNGYETTANTRATGRPVVLASAEGAGILFADTENIADANGLPIDTSNTWVFFTWTYQWVRVDGNTRTNVGGNSASYQPVAADVGKRIMVRVSYTDRGNFSETVNSLPFGPIVEPDPLPASTLVSNTGQSSTTANITKRYALGFRLGDHGQGYEISSVSIDLAAAPSRLTVSLWSGGVEGGFQPNSAYKLFDFENPRSFTAGLNKFTAPAGAFAYPNVNYFVVLSGFGSTLSIKETTSNNEDAGGETGAVIYDDAAVRALSDTGHWEISDDRANVLRMAVEGSKRVRGILASNYTQSPINDKGTEDTSDDVAGPPQEIISVGDEIGFGIELGAADRYLIRGVSFNMDDTNPSGSGFTNPFDLRSGSRTGTKQFSLTNTRKAPGLPVWTAPQGATVTGASGGQEYVFDHPVGQDTGPERTRRREATLERVAGAFVDGVDDPAAAGVSFTGAKGDVALNYPYMAVLGEPLNAMVQNLGQTDNGFVEVGGASAKVVSQGFRTGTNEFGYRLQGIGVEIEGSSNRKPDGPTSVSVSVYAADFGGKPGRKLFDLVSPGEYAAGHVFFEAPPGTHLAPTTPVVLVWRHLRGTGHRLHRTTDNGEDSGRATQSSIANSYYLGADVNNLTEDSNGNALQIAVYTEANTEAPFVIVVPEPEPETETEGPFVPYTFGDGYTVTCSAPPAEHCPTYDTVAGGDRTLLSATLTVAQEPIAGSTRLGYGHVLDPILLTYTPYGSLDNTTFTSNSTQYAIENIFVIGGGILLLDLTSGLGTDANKLTLHVGTQQFAFADARYNSDTQRYRWLGAVHSLSVGDSVELKITGPPLPNAYGYRTIWTALMTADTIGSTAFVGYNRATPSHAGDLTNNLIVTGRDETVTIGTPGQPRYPWIGYEIEQISDITTQTQISFDRNAYPSADEVAGWTLTLGGGVELPFADAQLAHATTPWVWQFTHAPGWSAGDQVLVSIRNDEVQNRVGQTAGEEERAGEVRFKSRRNTRVDYNTNKIAYGKTHFSYDHEPDKFGPADGWELRSLSVTTDETGDTDPVWIRATFRTHGSGAAGRAWQGYWEGQFDDFHTLFLRWVHNEGGIGKGEATYTLPLRSANGIWLSNFGRDVTFTWVRTYKEFQRRHLDLANHAAMSAHMLAPPQPATARAGGEGGDGDNLQRQYVPTTVTSVDFTSNPGSDRVYGFGDTIQVTVAFSEDVTVVYDGSKKHAAEVDLEMGGRTRTAHYAQTDGNRVIFEYTVVPGDEETFALLLPPNSLRLNISGSETKNWKRHSWIRDSEGRDVHLDHNGLGSTAHRVDAVSPEFASAQVSADGAQVAVTFDESIRSPARLRAWGLQTSLLQSLALDVLVDGELAARSDAAVSGDTITLTMAEPVTQGQTVAVSHDNLFVQTGETILQDLRKNKLLPFTEQPATNGSTVADVERPDGGLALSRTDLKIDEGQSGTYTVALASQPASDVTVAIGQRPTGRATVSPASLTFTADNWNTPQTVTITSTEDANYVDRWVLLRHVATGDSYGASAAAWLILRDTYNVGTTPANNRATGSPTIGGTPQVGQTLTLDTSGISDADGLTHASYTYLYQWIRNNANIAGQTESTYTLVDADEGKTIKVKVSFTDDANNAESRTSEATEAVAPPPNTPATGDPIIQGTPQVRRTLTVDTWAIEDADGMENAVLRYQWFATKSSTTYEYAGETDSTYKLVPADEGHTFHVEVSFTDDRGYSETLTSAATEAVAAAAPNSEPTGLPGVNGTPQVGETLTADTSAIDDPDGLENVSYRYQWISSQAVIDDVTGTSNILSIEIPGETGQTYTLIPDDEGSTFQVKVSFTDDAGYDESLTSAATVAVAPPPNSEPTGLPAVTGTPQVGETLTADTSAIDDADGLTNATFEYQWLHNQSVVDANTGTSYYINVEMPGETGSTYTLAPADKGRTFAVKVSFTDDRGHSESLTSGNTVIVAARPNSEPTGLPAITGTPQVGQVLTADTSAIDDEDGLENAVFRYQWFASKSGVILALLGETSSTYTLSPTYEGYTFQVRVTFTDDADNQESLTSEATEAVTATVPTEPLSLTVTAGSQVQELDASWHAPSSNGGSAVTGYKVQWKEAADSWDTEADVSEATVTGTTHTITGLTGGVEYAVRVMATNDEGDGPASTEAKGTPAGGVSEQVVEPENSAPTGLPGIGGTPQVDQTLTADTSPIDDEDGLENVSYGYQWIAGGTDIDGATGSTYTLTSSEQGKTIQVRVTFTDDANNEETLTSEATVAVAAAAPLTAAFHDLPDSHDGSTTFTFRVLFSEDVGISYVNMRDDAFSLSEGGVTGARRVDGRNDLWEITVEPGDNSDVGITLSANRSCATTGAICTREDSPRQLTNSPTATVTGPAEAPPTNTSAAGAPTISGAPQVEQTLTADTSSITDEDGLTNVSYSYQWIAGGSDIAGATGSTYTLTASEQGQTVQVRVTFTDDADNEETLTSAATVAVAAAPNREATGKPTIGGTPQVEETLTADTANIADQDGLTSVSYSYQWIAGGSDIGGATGSTYTLTASEQGKTIQVRVTFTDDADNEETLTSIATAEVTAAPAPLTASRPDSRFQSARHKGADDRPQVIVAFSMTVASFEKTTPSLSLTGAAVRSVRQHEENGLDNAWIFFLDPGGSGDIVFSLVTGRPCDSGGICTEDGEMLSGGVQVTLPGPEEEGEPDNPEPDDTNSPATGAPAISGTPQVGETLTADTSGIADADGLTKVSYSYQWTAGGSDIDGATGSSHTLTASEQGHTVQVRVTFTDDRNNAEALTSIATAAVAAAPEPLTVRLKVAAPATHDGSAEFTFEIEFSEEFGISYATLRDHAFNVTGGSVETAQRTDKPSNISWRITVKPQGTGDVTIVLPVTTDCGATGAICTGDGRKLSNSLSFTVSGPGQ